MNKSAVALTAIAFGRVYRLLQSGASTFDFDFDDVLKVHPTKLNIPCGSNKDSYSCSIQLTNITDHMIVAYRITSMYGDRGVVSRDEDTYVGTILPQSTSFVTVNGLKETRVSSLSISAFPLRDDVKAEDITKENLDCKSFPSRGFFELPVVYYKVPTATAANSCSAVPEKNEKKSLLEMITSLFHQSANDEVHGTSSEGEGGSVSSVKGQSSNKVSSIVLFSDQEIKAATNGLSDSSKIGQGGYGAVYKGILYDTEVAIKMLDPNSKQGIDEFLQEMEVLGRMRHPNLVKLIGACVKLRALIYEFLPHGSLGDCLQKNPEILTWQIRTRIVYEICSALTFLHSIKPQPVVHGDLKPANILLDANFISKLADFGLCRFLPEGTTTAAFLDTKPKGTFGYIDPEFMRTGILTPGCDLSSFGVTILKILTGMDVNGIVANVHSAYKGKSLMTMVDPTAGQWPVDVSELLAYFGLKCCAKRKSPGLMKEIAEDLEEILAEIGVDAVSTNMANNKLTVVGSVDPLKIREYVGSKTGKIVDLISPQPIKKEEESSGPKKADDKNSKPSNDDEVHGTTSEGKGSESSFMRQSYNEMSSIVLFSDDEIKGATNDLSDSSKIGQGGYGTVYKGNLNDSDVAIKILDPDSHQGIAEFHQEMDVLGRMRHKNLVKLIGACVKLRALVYEFLPHGSVEDCLKKNPGILTWQMRTRIVYDICLALTFLHSRQPQPVVHGDLKPANILLDANFISKLAYFGLCRFLPGGSATVAFLQTKNIKGTDWYIDPDFLETGKFTSGCDVYSFGITMLRILTGAPVARIVWKVERAIRKKSLMTMVDSTAGEWPEDVAKYLAQMGLECCEPERRSSKLMKDILTGLKDILAKIDT